MSAWRSTWSQVPARLRERYRATVQATLPAPCTLCPHLVHPDDPWDLDHLQPIHLGGSVHDHANHGPAHRACNRSAGATSGNTARSRTTRRIRSWTS